MRAPGPGSTGGSRPLPVETPRVHFVWVDAAIAFMLAFSAPLISVEVSHCQRTRAAALAGLHPEKVHLGLQQPPQLPCAAANLPERERLQRAAGGEEGPFRRGLWSRFAFDDFSPPHTGPYLPLFFVLQLVSG